MAMEGRQPQADESAEVAECSGVNAERLCCSGKQEPRRSRGRIVDLWCGLSVEGGEETKAGGEGALTMRRATSGEVALRMWTTAFVWLQPSSFSRCNSRALLNPQPSSSGRGYQDCISRNLSGRAGAPIEAACTNLGGEQLGNLGSEFTTCDASSAQQTGTKQHEAAGLGSWGDG